MTINGNAFTLYCTWAAVIAGLQESMLNGFVNFVLEVRQQAARNQGNYKAIPGARRYLVISLDFILVVRPRHRCRFLPRLRRTAFPLFPRRLSLYRALPTHKHCPVSGSDTIFGRQGT